MVGIAKTFESAKTTASSAGGAILLFLSLFLLLLVFFIVLNTHSALRGDRVKAALGSVERRFAAPHVVIAGGESRRDAALLATAGATLKAIGDALAAQLPFARIDTPVAGRQMAAVLPLNSLFEPDGVALLKGRERLFFDLADVLRKNALSASSGFRVDLEIFLPLRGARLPRPGRAPALSEFLPPPGFSAPIASFPMQEAPRVATPSSQPKAPQSQATRVTEEVEPNSVLRAGRLAQALIEAQAPSGAFSIGLEAGTPGLARFVFTVHQGGASFGSSVRGGKD
ncbi:putative MotB_plug domain-containing protein [Azospirillaceae bacterium]